MSETKFRITSTPQFRRKRIARTIELLISFFDGDADAMDKAIAEYRAKQQKQEDVR